MNGIGRRAFAEDDVDRIVLHRRVKDLLVGSVETMDLVDKKNIALIEVGKHRDQIARLFDRRTGGNAHIDAHLVGNDRSQRCLSQSRRAVQEHMIKRLIADLGGVDKDPEIFLCFLLADILRDRTRAQGSLPAVLRQADGGGDLFVDFVRKADSHTLLPLFDHAAQDCFDDLFGVHASRVCGLQDLRDLVGAVSKHRERRNGVPHSAAVGAWRRWRAEAFGGNVARSSDLVLQFKDHTLGDLFADTRSDRQRFLIPARNSKSKSLRRVGGED